MDRTPRNTLTSVSMSSTNEQDIPQAEVAAPDGTETDNLAIIARQAIVDANRAVYGYELFDRSTASDSHTAASDAALLFNALSYAGTEALVGKKTVFINCTHESLADQKGIHVGIAQGFDIVRGDDAALGHRNTVFANTIFQIQRGVERDFKGTQVTVVYADERGF